MIAPKGDAIFDWEPIGDNSDMFSCSMPFDFQPVYLFVGNIRCWYSDYFEPRIIPRLDPDYGWSAAWLCVPANGAPGGRIPDVTIASGHCYPTADEAKEQAELWYLEARQK